MLTTNANTHLLLPPPDLLIRVDVDNTAPNANQVVNYRVRYRCASITDNCENAQITMEFPAGVEITPPVPGGDMVSAIVTGQELTITLESSSTPGALAAGSSGVFTVGLNFPCLESGDTQSPTAGTTVNFVIPPTFTANGATPSVASNIPDITVPTFSECPAPNPPQPAEFRKSAFNGVMTANSTPQYTFVLPDAANVTYPLTITDEIPNGLWFSGVRYGGGASATYDLEVSCDGGATYHTLIDNGALQRDFYETQEANGTLNNLTDVNGDPTGCIGIIDRIVPEFAANPDGAQVNEYAIQNATHVRVVLPAGFPTQNGGSQPFNQLVIQFVTDEANLVPCQELQNCGVLTYGATTEESCVTRTYVGEYLTGSLVVQQLSNASGGNLGQTSIVTSTELSTVAGGTKNTLDVAMRLQFELNGSQSGLDADNPKFEAILPEGFDFITDGEDPNEFVVIPGGGSTSSDSDCTDNVQFFKEILPDGRTKITAQTTQCTLVGGVGRRIIYFDFTARFIGTRELLSLNPNPAFTFTGTLSVEGNTPFRFSDCEDEYEITRTRDLTFVQIENAESSKFVQGALDENYSRFPQFGTTTLDGEGNYVIEIMNLDILGVKRLDVVDILPHIGDYSLVSPSQARLSEWSAELAGAITVERFDIPTMTYTDASADLVGGIQYTNTYTPCYLDGSSQVIFGATNGPAGCGASDFSTANAADGARGFFFSWQNDAAPLSFGEKIRITVDIEQLAGEPDFTDGEIAWNSVAYTITNNSDTEFLSSEPIKTGLQMFDPNTVAGLGNYVWNDQNNNGRQDAGEPVFAGIAVSLYNADGTPYLLPDGTQLTTLTNEMGIYEFNGLPPNTNFIVRLENDADFSGQLLDYNLTTANAAGIDDGLDSDGEIGDVGGVGNGNYPETTASTPNGGEFDDTYDFGFFKAAQVCGLVFEDADEEGDRDLTDVLVENVSVTLRNANDDSVVQGPIQTNVNGGYLFSNLTTGIYYIEFMLPTGQVTTAKDATGTDTNDSDVNTNGRTDVFSIASCDYVCYDLGLRAIPPDPASIAGSVWDELGTKNGQMEIDEPLLSNITVQLLDTDGFVLNTTTTDASGNYIFENLTPNETYQIAFIPPSLGTTFTIAGTDMDADPVTGVTTQITPTANENITGIDAGVCGLYAIGNLVFLDENNNGLFDANETPFSNITVNLLDAATDAVLSTTTTDANGRYLFTLLEEGDYKVAIDPPADYQSSTDIASTNTPNQLDSDDNGIGASSNSSIVSSTIQINAANVGSNTAPNWTETDRDEVINGIDDPVSNPKAFYTVDFGLFLPPPCVTPSFDPLVVSAGTCSGATSNNDATLTVNNITNADQANLSQGNTYTGPAYGDANNTDVSGGTFSSINLMHNTEYTLRVWNGQANCFVDETFTTASIDCTVCALTITQNMQNTCEDNGTTGTDSDDYFTVDVNATATDGGTQYQAVLNANPDGTGGIALGTSNYGTAITLGNGTNGATGTFLADGSSTYTITLRDAMDNTCHDEFTTTPVNDCAVPCPMITNSSPAQTICEGQTITTLSVDTDANTPNQIEFVYFTNQQLGDAMYTGGTSLGIVSPNAGSAGISNVGFPGVGTYYVYAILSPTPTEVDCRPFQEIQVVVNPLPSINLTVSDTTVCEFTNALPIVFGSEVGVNYQLREEGSNNPVGSAVAGTGGNISFILEDLSPAGTYTYNVLATNTNSGCSAELTDRAVVLVEPCDFQDFLPICDFPACHFTSTDIYLGSGVTSEAQTTGNNNADSDTDDGASFPNDIRLNNQIRVPVTIYNNTMQTAYLSAWIDWNGDGDFEDAGEQIVNETYPYVLPNTGTFQVSLPITVPSDALQDSDIGVRFRLSTDYSIQNAPCGAQSCATDGEVEDYLIQVECPPRVCVPVEITINRN